MVTLTYNEDGGGHYLVNTLRRNAVVVLQSLAAHGSV